MKLQSCKTFLLPNRGIKPVSPAILLMLAVSAWADSPALSFSPPKFDLGAQLVATTGQAVVETLQNETAVPLLLGAVHVEGGDAGDFAVTPATSFPLMLAPGANIAVAIAFTPRAPWRPGRREAHLKVTTGVGVYSLALTGMGVTCGGLVWAAASNGACSDTDGDGFNDEWEDRGYIDLNNNGLEDEGDFRFPYRESHHFSPVIQTGTGTGQVFPTVSDPRQPLNTSSVSVRIVGDGSLGTATFRYSIGGHSSGDALIVSPVVDLRENLRLQFYGATFVAGGTYTFTTGMGQRTKVADKSVPNIYVQYDYMGYAAGSNSCTTNNQCSEGGLQPNNVCQAHTCTHGHKPGDPLFRKLVDQFAAHGITLYIDPVHEALPHAEVITFSTPDEGTEGALAACAGADVVKGNIGPGQLAVSFADVKNRPGSDFAREPVRKDIYHYAVIGHANTCLTDATGVPGSCKSCPSDRSTPAGFPFATSTGTAELPGNDFIVSLGPTLNDGSQPTNPFLEGGVFMHELGHNLGLHHAGDVAVPQSAPNYLSVMNYRYTTTGITHAATPGSTVSVETLRELNYSEHELQTLTEGSLDEQAGVSPLSSGYTGLLRFFTATGGNNGIGSEAGPIDWTGDGLIELGPVVVDLNQLNGPTETMKGYSDWVHHACEVQPECPVNGIRLMIHENYDSSVDPHELCVQTRCQSLWLPFQFTQWGKKD
jgi:hypothetical protein